MNHLSLESGYLGSSTSTWIRPFDIHSIRRRRSASPRRPDPLENRVCLSLFSWPHYATLHHCTSLHHAMPDLSNITYITTEQTIRSSQIESDRVRSGPANVVAAHWLLHWAWPHSEGSEGSEGSDPTGWSPLRPLRPCELSSIPTLEGRGSTVPLLRTITHKPSQKVVYYIILQCTTINIHKPLLSCSCLMIFWCFLQFCRQETYFTLPFSKATLMQPAGMV